VDIHTVTLQVIGGGGVPSTKGVIHAGWPRVVLRVTGGGVEVEIQNTWLNRVLRPRGPWRGRAHNFPITWAVAWPQLVRAEAGHRSVVLFTTDNGSCRFATLSRRQILPALEALQARGISVVNKRTTLGWVYRNFH
jgi:hypothetical protein